tara:strand:+ start:626 stop:1306 length:681 start_codon:yes stop_codon:yes gene_type:complete
MSGIDMSNANAYAALQKSLLSIQSKLKAPKEQMNDFGNYKYRSAEDILEEVKPLLKEENLVLTITEEVVEVSLVVCLKSTAKIENSLAKIETTAYAGIDPNRKGMDIAQSFGSSSSYAKKYALGNLFLLDDTKDPDTNPPPKKQSKKPPPKPKAKAKATNLPPLQRPADSITEKQIDRLRKLCQNKAIDQKTVDHVADGVKGNKFNEVTADAEIKLLEKEIKKHEG